MDKRSDDLEALKRAVLESRARKLLASRAQSAPQERIPAAPPGARLPLSWSQQRLWFLDQLDHAAGAAYLVPAALRLSGVLDRQALKASLDRIVARHDNLRTSFASDEQGPFQLIAPADSGCDMDIVDLCHLEGEAGEAALEETIRHELGQPFALAQGRLIRARLFCLSDTEHVLCVTQHHIVSDGWSRGVFVREMFALYAAFSQGKSDPLPPLSLQYADYALWQRGWLQGETLQRQRDFWSAQLAGAPALLTLPTDRPRPAAQSYAGATVELRLSAGLSESLRALSQRHGATLFMTLLAGWSVLMARLSGQDDVVTGTPVANRQRSETEALIGFFVNTLALRVNLGADPTVAELLAQVKAGALAAYSHQDLPFDQVVDAIKAPRTLGHNPLFQVMLALGNTPSGSALSVPGLTLSSIAHSAPTAQFDLALDLVDAGGAIAGTLTYASDLFDAASAQRFAGYFESVLTAMAQDAQQPVSRLPLLGAAERAQLLTQFNPPALARHPGLLAHHLFEQQAAMRAQDVALEFGARKLSYEALNGRANALAHRLRELGIGPDTRVAICLERGVEMVVCLLAVLKAGGAYVPLDPAYPAARLSYMLDDCAPAVMLTQASLCAGFAGLTVPVLAVDEDVAALPARMDNSAMDGPGALAPQHLAYVIYTSGSTGMPKGVMNHHQGLCNLALAQAATFRVQPDSRVLQFASFSFDASISEIMMTLTAGATLVLAAREALMPGPALCGTLQAQAITHVTLPSLAVATIPADLPLALQCLIMAGDACPPQLAATWAARCAVFNAYGPTESTVCATIHACGTEQGASVPIGRPMANLRMYVLDRHLQPAPLGVTGELYIGGMGVARGYLNRPELTAERFLPDPFGAEPGARMYRTGDLGRWLADGSLDYLGRNDFQVKIRGFRIELGEIEAKLAACAGVREALVIAREDSAGDKRLVAYLLAAPGAAPDAASLRAELAASLAEFMLPVAFVTLPAWPLTPNGKLDRQALPAPGQDAVAVRAYEAPQGVVEHAIARIWQQLLGLDRVSRHDHFFELGGHSLLATRAATELSRALGMQVALRSLFAQPVLHRLAETIGAGKSASATPNLINLRAEGEAPPLFLIHDGSGGLGYAHRVMASLAPGFPVYGLMAGGLTGDDAAQPATVEDMASAYLRQIRLVQPHGPYRLAGYSAGGTVAYEMANQLLGCDASVAFLGLIDSHCDYRARAGASTPLARGEVAQLLQLIEGADDIAPATLERLRTLGLQQGAQALFEQAQAEGILASATTLPMLRRALAVAGTITSALESYARAPITVPVTLFCALDTRCGDKRAAWHAHLPRHSKVVPIGGDHLTMMQAPHVDHLAAALSLELGGPAPSRIGHDEHDYDPLITLQTGRPGQRPLFCVPGAGASVTAFTGLVQEFDPAVPVYGLQPRGFCGRLAPHVDVESAARAYIRALRTVDPAGPYRLLGHSFGGWVAHEMALQLRAQGSAVELLVVLDSQSPFEREPASRWSRVDMLMRLVGLFDLSAATPLDIAPHELQVLDHDAQLRLLLTRLVDVKLMHARTSVDVLRGLVRVFETNLNTHYAPSAPWSGRLHLVDVTEGRNGPDSDQREVLGWLDHVAEVTHWTGPGNHNTLLNAPHVGQLARWMRTLVAAPGATVPLS